MARERSLGQEQLEYALNLLKANGVGLQKSESLGGRVHFVPEEQHDSSQARSAWVAP
jgi:hypothetical protein